MEEVCEASLPSHDWCEEEADKGGETPDQGHVTLAHLVIVGELTLMTMMTMLMMTKMMMMPTPISSSVGETKAVSAA